MNAKTCCALLTLSISSWLYFNAAYGGQDDFFYSFANLNDGAANQDVNAVFQPGESGSLYIYYTTNGPSDSELDTGAFLDIASSNAGVIQFTAAETFNFDIELNGFPIGDPRWNPQAVGQNANVTNDFVDNLAAFNPGATGTGILESHTGPDFLDTGYDSGADSFLWGRIDFVATGNPGQSTQLLTTPGFQGGIVNDGEVVDATFGDVTISIVPEPSIFCSCPCIAMLMARRRRISGQTLPSNQKS